MPRLRRTFPDQPGWTRRRSGKGFTYLDEHGHRLDAEQVQPVVVGVGHRVGDRHRAGHALGAGRVHLLEEGDRLEVLPPAVHVRAPLAVVAAVVEVEHARHRVDPEAVALAFSLTLRAIPTTIAIADETRDAAVARGLERSPRARLTPLVIRVVAHARATGEALQARGIGDDPPQGSRPTLGP